MPIVQLVHATQLGYASASQLPFLPTEIDELRNSATIISFRSSKRNKSDLIKKNFHACERLIEVPGENLIFFGVESDSPLAPLILWDAAHSLPVGGTILLAGDPLEKNYLERSYYSDALIIEHKNPSGTLLRKVKILPAEIDSGLNRWSFCIPTGSEDATLLNVAVKRILELNIQKKEILLCGRPGENFKYWDHVRIVGEDISAPPVQISRKKNRLAQEARYENLCILHDRVFLPRDFDHAIQKFGDTFPITTFQSLYFDDKWNALPRRYSDIGMFMSSLDSVPLGLFHGSSNDLSHFSPSVFAEFEATGFIYSNAHRYERERYYTTGSLYLAKRSVWLKCPQDNSKLWAEFEDIEHSHRASLMGIPSRVNPYGLTQSIISRPIMTIGGRVSYEEITGEIKQSASRPWLLALPRKPFIKLSATEAYRRLNLFAKKYVSSKTYTLTEGKKTNTSTWLNYIGRLVLEAKFPFRRESMREFINDYERWVLLDQLPYARKQFIEDQFLIHGENAKVYLFELSVELTNFASQRTAGYWFYDSLDEYLPQRCFMLNIGSFFSAWHLWRNPGNFFLRDKGLWGYYQSILNSTPFKSYAVREK